LVYALRLNPALRPAVEAANGRQWVRNSPKYVTPATPISYE
jgi:hypothetical protein